MVVVFQNDAASNTSWTSNGNGRYTLTCRCGYEYELGENRLNKNGVVRPYFRCPSCGFKDEVKLKGYK